MSKVKNLWGNIAFPITSDTDSCINLLLEQVKLLESQTKGLLKGEITKSQGESFVRGVTRHDLTLVAPKLSDYRYTILRIATGYGIYPVFMYDRGQCDGAVWENTQRTWGKDIAPTKKIPLKQIKVTPSDEASLVKPTYEAKTYEEFEEALAKILQSDATKEVIKVLLSKSQSVLLNKL